MDEEIQADRGRVLHQIINAHSPQAKGRGERKHGVYQDRFVKELRGVKCIEEANVILQGGLIKNLNRKFSHVSRALEDFQVALRHLLFRRVAQRQSGLGCP